MEVLTHGVTHVLRPDILELLIGLAVLVTLLVLAGLILQVIGSARNARRFPPPGQLVDVGGHRLHIYCMGGGHASGSDRLRVSRLFAKLDVRAARSGQVHPRMQL